LQVRWHVGVAAAAAGQGAAVQHAGILQLYTLAFEVKLTCQ
jgi:hypothetical protein